MFTGLVERKGRIESLRRRSGGATIVLSAPFAHELELGESVAVNGVCLTVVRKERRRFEVEAIARTLSRSTLGRMTAGADVNLERSLEVGDRLGGHVVTGHVDGVGVVRTVERASTGKEISIELPGELTRHVVPRGSIAIDGVSLTVADVTGSTVVVALIPATLDVTIAASYRPGTRVNVETDGMAKQQERLAAQRDEAASERSGEAAGLTMERLRELGFVE